MSEKINVVFTGACNRCSCVNDSKILENQDKDLFLSKMKQDPDQYWSETNDNRVKYRHHEESSNYNCRYSCN